MSNKAATIMAAGIFVVGWLIWEFISPLVWGFALCGFFIVYALSVSVWQQRKGRR